MPTHNKFRISQLHILASRHFEFRIWRFNKGFTLIELLVVISIIAILITVIVATFGTTQQKARDSRRKTDLDALKKGLELHKSDSPGSAWYPSCASQGSVSSGSCKLTSASSLAPALDVRYLKDFPLDPKTKDGYWYILPSTTPANCQTVGTGLGSTFQCTDYQLVACLENSNDSSRDTTPNSNCQGAQSYTITNP